FLWPTWKTFARIFRTDRGRELFLAYFAPLALLSLMAMWTFLLGISYALMALALGKEFNANIGSFYQGFYFAVSSFATMSTRFLPQTGASQTVQILAAMSGIVIFAAFVSLLFNLFNIILDRETEVNLFANRAGTPPCGFTFLENAG